MDNYIIHYFSGTGNTYHMVKTIESELRNKAYEVTTINIEEAVNIKDYEVKDYKVTESNNNVLNELIKEYNVLNESIKEYNVLNESIKEYNVLNESIKEYNVHIFCFPVYGFGTPSIMLRYISNFKFVNGYKAAIVCTSGGAEGQSLNHCKYLLNKKGFKVFYTDMLIYTHNWTQVLNPQSKDVEEKVFKKAEIKILEVTKKIMDSEVYIMKSNFVAVLISWIIFGIFSNLARRILGKTFIAEDSCVNCGKCKKNCPAKAINIYDEEPRWNSKCESCQRCINMCPKKSIQISIVKLAIFAILELLPIFIIIEINKQIYDIPIILNIVLFCVLFLFNTFLADRLIYIAEKVKIFRRVFQFSYTKKYRRNIAKGFNIK